MSTVHYSSLVHSLLTHALRAWQLGFGSLPVDERQLKPPKKARALSRPQQQAPPPHTCPESLTEALNWITVWVQLPSTFS